MKTSDKVLYLGFFLIFCLGVTLAADPLLYSPEPSAQIAELVHKYGRAEPAPRTTQNWYTDLDHTFKNPEEIKLCTFCGCGRDSRPWAIAMRQDGLDFALHMKCLIDGTKLIGRMNGNAKDYRPRGVYGVQH